VKHSNFTEEKGVARPLSKWCKLVRRGLPISHTEDTASRDSAVDGKVGRGLVQSLTNQRHSVESKLPIHRAHGEQPSKAC
jgi:hypothetical protein